MEMVDVEWATGIGCLRIDGRFPIVNGRNMSSPGIAKKRCQKVGFTQP